MGRPRVVWEWLGTVGSVVFHHVKQHTPTNDAVLRPVYVVA